MFWIITAFLAGNVTGALLMTLCIASGNSSRED